MGFIRWRVSCWRWLSWRGFWILASRRIILVVICCSFGVLWMAGLRVVRVWLMRGPRGIGRNSRLGSSLPVSRGLDRRKRPFTSFSFRTWLKCRTTPQNSLYRRQSHHSCWNRQHFAFLWFPLQPILRFWRLWMKWDKLAFYYKRLIDRPDRIVVGFAFSYETEKISLQKVNNC